VEQIPKQLGAFEEFKVIMDHYVFVKGPDVA
jgi:hypothetical protein